MAKDKSSSLIDDKNKKYKLFAVARLDDPNIKPICAFFQSAAGCRNGATCKFAHEVSNTTATTHYDKSANVAVVNIPKTLSTPSNNNDKRLSNKVVVSTAASITSVISSKSSDNDSSEEEPQVYKAVPVSMGKNKAGNKRKVVTEQHQQTDLQKQNNANKRNKSIRNSNTDDDDNPFGYVLNTTEILKPKKEDLCVITVEDTNALDFRALASKLPVTPATTPSIITTTPGSKHKIKKQELTPQQEHQHTDIRALTSSLPVSSFYKVRTELTPSQGKDTVDQQSDFRALTSSLPVSSFSRESKVPTPSKGKDTVDQQTDFRALTSSLPVSSFSIEMTVSTPSPRKDTVVKENDSSDDDDESDRNKSIGNTTTDDYDIPLALVTNTTETLKHKSEDLRVITAEDANFIDFRALAAKLPVTPATTPSIIATTSGSKHNIQNQEYTPQQGHQQTDFRALTASLPVSSFSMERMVSTPSQGKDTVDQQTDSRGLTSSLPVSSFSMEMTVSTPSHGKDTVDQQTDIRALTSSPPVSSFSMERKELTPSPGKDTVDQQPDFRALSSGLPVSSFSREMAAVWTPSGMSRAALTSSLPVSSFNINAKREVVESVLPTSHPDGMKWKDLVIKSRLHPRYMKLSAKNEEVWIKPRPYGPWCADLPQAIAIDCEMCVTKDPKTGKRDEMTLCRLSVVNAANPSEVLIDTLVKPEWPVTDYVSWVHGIYESDLENVEFTLKHAQEFMYALCSEETVILGHAVHHDLKAIKMEHDCLVDSSYLFTVKGGNKSSLCALRDVARHALQKTMPLQHDSVNDARTTLEAIEVYLALNGLVGPVERTPKPRPQCVDGDGQPDTMKLLIHRIPTGGIVSESHIEKMFLHLTNIKPISVEKFDFSGAFGKTLVSFYSPEDANLAFLTLVGEADMDKGNYAQKKVFLKNKDFVRVRKMIPEEREHDGSDDEA